MKWRNRTEVLFSAAAAFPRAEYDERLPWHFRMSGRPSWRRLVAATAVFARATGAEVLVVCGGESSEWRNVPKRRVRSAVELPTAAEAVDFIRRHSHYRTNIFADYYLTDTSFRWLSKFCHDDDWHVFLPETLACSLPVKRAYFDLRFSSMPPWPPADLYE